GRAGQRGGEYCCDGEKTTHRCLCANGNEFTASFSEKRGLMRLMREQNQSVTLIGRGRSPAGGGLAQRTNGSTDARLRRSPCAAIGHALRVPMRCRRFDELLWPDRMRRGDAQSARRGRVLHQYQSFNRPVFDFWPKTRG